MKMKPLHMVLVSRYYPPDPGGGLALYTRQIAREFSRLGHSVDVIAATTESKGYLEDDEGVLVKRIPQQKVYHRSLTGATCLWNSYQIAMTLRQLHQEYPVDVIHCPATFFESLVFGMLNKGEERIPLVVKFHENRETYERVDGGFQRLKRWRRQWFKAFMRQAAIDGDYWLGVSQNALDGTLDYLGLSQLYRPRSVSASPLDLDLLKPTPPPEGYLSAQGLPEGAKFLLYSGRLIHEKGLHLLVDAFLSQVAPQYPELHLAIAGEFDYRQPHYEARIRKQMAGHSAAQRIHLLGRVPYEELPCWYSSCQLFVAPSFSEPFGRVFIEAMACKAPVIGFNSAGPAEFITQNVDGHLVSEQTSDSLAQAICLLLENQSQRELLRKNCRETVERQYSQEQVALELLEIYQKLTNEATEKGP